MKRILSVFLLLVLIMSLAAGTVAEAADTTDNKSSFEVYFLDVGKGDCAVVLCDGYSMIIDGGTAAYSDKVYSFLKKHGLDRLDYMVCTHTDSDHCGGLAGALNYADAGVVFCTDTAADKEPFQNFLKYLEKQNNRIIVPSPGDTFSLGSASVSILAPERGVKLSDNTSIVLRITYGSTSFLFMGDAEEEDEDALMSTKATLKSTVLKVAHHGSNSSTGSKFLKKVDPDYAVISVGDNSNGHPTEAVLGRLQSAKVKLYRTDIQGTIHCESNGKKVTFDVERNPDLDTFDYAGGYSASIEEKNATADTETAIVDRSSVDSDNSKEDNTPQADYVVNKNSMKFHYPSCSSVKKMKESNKWYYTGTRDELISKGYSPCGNCHP